MISRSVTALALGASLFGAASVAVANQEMLNTSSNIPHFTGALRDVKPPAYDGPVRWGYAPTDNLGFLCPAIGLGFLGTMIGGIAMETALETNKERGPWDPAAPAVPLGMLLGCTLGVAAATQIPISPPEARAIIFQTTVSEIPQAAPPHYERHGKTTSGPYYSQVVAIPESQILLATNVTQAPFIPGQRIDAVVYVKQATNEILSWRAEAAPRSAGTTPTAPQTSVTNP